VETASLSKLEASTNSSGSVKVQRALISVSDKTGVVEFATGLRKFGVELLSTGGTAKALKDAGLEVTEVSDLTGFPEIMDGRVKTLHPKLHGGLLARRDSQAHLDTAVEHDIDLIDLVCVNLYPFEQTISRADVTYEEAVENIDIGGPAMIRSAAKNHASVAVVVDPSRYQGLLEELDQAEGALTLDRRRQLACEAFTHTARYDQAVSGWFTSQLAEVKDRSDSVLPESLVDEYTKEQELSYGENPHQAGAYYRRTDTQEHLLGGVKQLGGKDLSFNNLLDLQSAKALVAEFKEPACAILKHNNPCGCAVADSAEAAYLAAFACDPVSAFGGVIAFNREVDEALADQLLKQFIEVLYAPAYTDGALNKLAEKPNLRILQGPQASSGKKDLDIRYVEGGLLVQQLDQVVSHTDAMKVVAGRQPSSSEWSDLLFAWQVCKHVRSNAVVIARDGATLGIGAGQMSRVDSVRLAVEKSQADSLNGAVLASDAFFPFADGPQLAIDAGIKLVVQPGGSIRDDEVIAAAEDAGVTMVLTGMRHFRH